MNFKFRPDLMCPLTYQIAAYIAMLLLSSSLLTVPNLVCKQVAVELEKAALADSYFVQRKLYPNVDFYSGLIYRSAVNFESKQETLFSWHGRNQGVLRTYPVIVFNFFRRALGFPTEFFPVLFAIPRMAGYLAHWKESLDDQDTKIMRPQQVVFRHHHVDNCSLSSEVFFLYRDELFCSGTSVSGFATIIQSVIVMRPPTVRIWGKLQSQTPPGDAKLVSCREMGREFSNLLPCNIEPYVKGQTRSTRRRYPWIIMNSETSLLSRLRISTVDFDLVEGFTSVLFDTRTYELSRATKCQNGQAIILEHQLQP